MLTFGPVEDIDSRDWVWGDVGFGTEGRAPSCERSERSRPNFSTSQSTDEPLPWARTCAIRAGTRSAKAGGGAGVVEISRDPGSGFGKRGGVSRPAPPGGGSRTFARGMVCAGAEVWPTPAAPLMMSASNLSALSSMPALACVRVSAPLIPDVAFVLLPPRKGHLSRSMTRPPCSRTVCAAESPARPPPMTMTCSAMARVFLL